MPSPIGHVLTGLAVNVFSTKKKAPLVSRDNFFWATLCVFVSLTPDFDFFIWKGDRIGVSSLYHHGIMHSAGFAVIMGAVTGLWSKIRGFAQWKKVAIITTVAWIAHIVADLLCVDEYPANGTGLPVLWPITDQYFIIPLIPAMDRGDVFSAGNFIALFFELALFGAALAAGLIWRRRVTPVR